MEWRRFTIKDFFARAGMYDSNDICLLTFARGKDWISGDDGLAYNKLIFEKVKNYKDLRLLRSHGNINLADVWYTHVREPYPEGVNDICEVALFRRNLDGLTTDTLLSAHSKYMGVVLGTVCDQEKTEDSLITIYQAVANKCHSTGSQHEAEDHRPCIIYRSFDYWDFAVFFPLQSNTDTSNAGTFNTDFSNVWCTLTTVNQINKMVGFVCEGLGTEYPVCDQTWYSVKGKCEKYKNQNYSSPAYMTDARSYFDRVEQTLSKLKTEVQDSRSESSNALIALLYQSVLKMDRILEEEKTREIYESLIPSFMMLIESVMSLGLFTKDSMLMNTNTESILSETILLKNRYDSLSSIETYLEAVYFIANRVLQSNSSILERTAYSWDMFPIPQGLYEFYTALSYDIISLLKDDDSNQYSFIIYPSINQNSRNEVLELAEGPRKRLLYFVTSQRILYMPRSFIVMMCHEFSHYVGQKTRDRETRYLAICNILGNFFIYKLKGDFVQGIKTNIDLTEEEKAILLVDTNFDGVVRLVTSVLQKNRNRVLSNKDDVNLLHSTSLRKQWIASMPNILEEIEQKCLNAVVVAGNKELERFVCKEKIWRAIKSASEYMLTQFKNQAYTGEVAQLPIDVCQEMTELHADISMIYLLQQQYSWREYIETLIVSNGDDLSKHVIKYSSQFRIAFVILTFIEKDFNSRRAWNRLLSEAKNPRANDYDKPYYNTICLINEKIEFIKSVLDNGTIKTKRIAESYIYDIIPNLLELKCYCDSVYDKLHEHFETLECDKILKMKELRSIFDCVVNQPSEYDKFPNRFFVHYDHLLTEYRRNVCEILRY